MQIPRALLCPHPWLCLWALHPAPPCFSTRCVCLEMDFPSLVSQRVLLHRILSLSPSVHRALTVTWVPDTPTRVPDAPSPSPSAPPTLAAAGSGAGPGELPSSLPLGPHRWLRALIVTSCDFSFQRFSMSQSTQSGDLEKAWLLLGSVQMSGGLEGAPSVRGHWGWRDCDREQSRGPSLPVTVICDLPEVLTLIFPHPFLPLEMT